LDTIFTYTLKNGQKRSDHYYEKISTFSDEVLDKVESQAGSLLDSFLLYLEDTQRETLRFRSEYEFELLTLGVLWRVYAGHSVSGSGISQSLLAWLVKQRKKIQLLKPSIDFLRGVLAAIFLRTSNSINGKTPSPNLENLDSLLDWLAATGDFKEEVKRLRAWRDFFAILNPNEAARNLSKIISLAGWFEERSLKVLGEYTPHVNQFIEKSLPKYRWREDRIFVGRQRVEYHLNMVGAEILNRTMRDRFLDTERKLVIVPPCMSAKFDGECEATPTPMGDLCAACTPNCRVHQVTQLGKKHGFGVLIMGDDLSVYSGKKEKKVSDENTLGIVGVSCPLTNVTGHWETRDLNVPVQGVLLDYCGCPWHWDLKKGISTDINFDQLLKRVGVKD
jgi:hypothetical protein